MTVGGAFVYVCEPVKEVMLKILNNGSVNISRVLSRGPRQPHYNGVAVYM